VPASRAEGLVAKGRFHLSLNRRRLGEIHACDNRLRSLSASRLMRLRGIDCVGSRASGRSAHTAEIRLLSAAAMQSVSKEIASLVKQWKPLACWSTDKPTQAGSEPQTPGACKGIPPKRCPFTAHGEDMTCAIDTRLFPVLTSQPPRGRPARSRLASAIFVIIDAFREAMEMRRTTPSRYSANGQ
jgi:hypothetical protein